MEYHLFHGFVLLKEASYAHSPFPSTRSPLGYRYLLGATPMIWLLVFAAITPADAGSDGGRLDYKVGFLGIPSSVTQFEMSVPVPWTRELSAS